MNSGDISQILKVLALQLCCVTLVPPMKHSSHQSWHICKCSEDDLQCWCTAVEPRQCHRMFGLFEAPLSRRKLAGACIVITSHVFDQSPIKSIHRCQMCPAIGMVVVQEGRTKWSHTKSTSMACMTVLRNSCCRIFDVCG